MPNKSNSVKKKVKLDYNKTNYNKKKKKEETSEVKEKKGGIKTGEEKEEKKESQKTTPSQSEQKPKPSQPEEFDFKLEDAASTKAKAPVLETAREKQPPFRLEQFLQTVDAGKPKEDTKKYSPSDNENRTYSASSPRPTYSASTRHMADVEETQRREVMNGVRRAPHRTSQRDFARETAFREFEPSQREPFEEMRKYRTEREETAMHDSEPRFKAHEGRVKKYKEFRH